MTTLDREGRPLADIAPPQAAARGTHTFDGPRGPATEWAGEPSLPALVVVDPGGTRYDGMPAIWRSMAQRYRIAWCRARCGRRARERVEDAVQSLADEAASVDVIACGPADEIALSVATQFRHLVRNLVLVDPAATHPTGSDDPGVHVTVLNGGPRTPRERIESPTALGDRFVMNAIADALPETAPETTHP